MECVGRHGSESRRIGSRRRVQSGITAVVVEAPPEVAGLCGKEKGESGDRPFDCLTLTPAGDGIARSSLLIKDRNETDTNN
jgi:hypothetical protein